jgi:fucose permease
VPTKLCSDSPCKNRARDQPQLASLHEQPIGAVVGIGEIFGGGIAPSVAGAIAQNFGIAAILWLALSGVCVGVLLCLFLEETAPRKVSPIVAL